MSGENCIFDSIKSILFLLENADNVHRLFKRVLVMKSDGLIPLILTAPKVKKNNISYGAQDLLWGIYSQTLIH